jgi:hypothetical protein
VIKLYHDQADATESLHAHGQEIIRNLKGRADSPGIVVGGRGQPKRKTLLRFMLALHKRPETVVIQHSQQRPLLSSLYLTNLKGTPNFRADLERSRSAVISSWLSVAAIAK